VRFHRLTIAGVGPFRAQQEIDFDAVSASGLFLIEGPTGAGKTTIIDAIVFALYGSLSGAESDPGRMRSHLCQSDERTEVTLDFSVGGVRHTITRNPAYQRRKARGEGTTTERAAQTLRVHDDATPDMREAKEIGVYLTQRIGLTVDQFRRLVVLPQGEFDTLLQAKPIDRYRTIAGLIDDGFLQRVQEDLKQRADEALLVRRDAAAEVDRLLDVMRERAAEVIEIVGDFNPEGVLAEITREADAAAGVAAQTAATLQARQAAEHAARARADAAKAAIEARLALERASREAGPDAAALDDAGVQALLAQLVAQRTRLEPLAAWEEDAEARARESARRHAHADAASQRIEAARAEAAALPGRHAEAEAALSEARVIADRAAALETEVQRLSALQAAFHERTALEAAVAAARAKEAASADALQSAREALHAARTAHHELVRTQLDQRATLLASLLVDGAPCPVCGSCDHPLPAHAGAGRLVSDADVAAADKAAGAAEAAESTAAAARDTARAELAALDQQLAGVLGRLDGTTEDDVASALRAATSARDEARSCAERLPDLAAAVAGLAAQVSASAAGIESLVAEEATARADARAYDARVEEEAARHREQVGQQGRAADLLASITSRISALESLLRARTAAAGLSLDDSPDAAQAACDQAEAERLQAQAAHAAADERRVRWSDARTALSALAVELAAAREALDAVGSETQAAIQLGSLVTAARGSANLRSLTLQAYAVQRRFRSVLEAASVHLERMSAGKFAFALDETASGGAQAGLGIDIVDAWSGQSRDPGTLSGGERFYASLSLALGLADIVREESGGVSLDTLFVDEGFGSLDADTLTVVLDQLDALRSRGRVVGVISHVTEMKEWVHDRIVVEPGAPGHGSRVAQSA
jgi:DNA repair protein SbcC/Rad50